MPGGGAQAAEGLLERAAELAALDAALADAAAGRGAFVLISGPPGIGKTSLLRHAREQAERSEMTVLSGRGAELGHGLAFGVLRQLYLRTVRRHAETLLRGPADVARFCLGLDHSPDAQLDSAAVAHGMYWLTADLAELSPLLLLVDDVQWVDAASRQVLSHLGAHVEELGIGMVVGLRDDPTVAIEFAHALSTRGSAELRPRPLSIDGVRELATTDTAGAQATEALAAALHQASGGVPFLVEQLIDEIDTSGASGDAAVARVAQLAPRSVRRSVLVRLAHLPADAQALARAVSVLPLPTDLGFAAELAGISRSVCAAAATSLVQVHVLRDADQLDMLHPITRTAIYQDMPAHERAGLHARAAHLLQKRDAPIDEVASHLLHTPPTAHPETARVLHGAGRAALAAGAAAGAMRYLLRALEEPPPPGERSGVLADLGRAAGAAGDPSAVEHLQAAFDTAADAAGRAGVVGELADVLCREHGRDDEAMDLLWRTIEELDEGDDTRLALLADYYLACAAATDFSSRFRRMARLVPPDLPGDTPAQRACIYAMTEEEFTSGHVDRVRADIVRAKAGPQTVQDAGPGSAWGIYAVAVIRSAGDLRLAEQIASGVVEHTRRAGRRGALARALSVHAAVLFRLGRLADAELQGGSACQLVEGADSFEAAFAAACYARTLVARDKLDLAEQVLEPFTGDGPGGPVAAPAVVRAAAELAAARGDLEHAAELELRAGELWTSANTNDLAPSLCEWGHDAAVHLAAVGRGPDADAILTRQLARARQFGEPAAIARLLCASGVVERRAELLREGIAMLTQTDFHLDHAGALVDLGVVLSRCGHKGQAREQLRAGLAASRDLGALLLARRAEDELRAAGGRAVHKGLSGVDALTPSELRIATLAAGGMANKQIAQQLFLSLGTVEMHLRNSYRKLSISSRQQLSMALASS